MLYRVVAAFVALLVLVGGIAVALKGEGFLSTLGDKVIHPPSATDDSSDADDPATTKDQVCGSLSGKQRTRLVGRPTPTKLESFSGSFGDYDCRWSPRDDDRFTFVQLVAVPADLWAKRIRREVAGMDAAPAVKARLTALLKRPHLTRADGCEVARTVFVAEGAQPGEERVVTQSTFIGVPSLTAQSCVRGTYYAVSAVAAGLKPGPALLDDLRADLALVEKIHV